MEKRPIEKTAAQHLEDPELRSQIKTTLLSLLGLLLLLLLAGVFFEEEIQAGGRWIYERMGLLGLGLLIFLGDSVVTPIPPDIALVIIRNSDLAENAHFYVGLLGCISVLAGSLGWMLGKLLRKSKLPRWIFGAKLQPAEKLFKKFGPLAVSIGALTPLPYSITTWTAGMFGLKFHRLFLPTLLRIPRFYLYYWLLDGAFSLGSLF